MVITDIKPLLRIRNMSTYGCINVGMRNRSTYGRKMVLLEAMQIGQAQKESCFK